MNKKMIIGVAIAVVAILLVISLIRGWGQSDFNRLATYDCGQGYLFQGEFTDNDAVITLPGGDVLELDRVSSNKGVVYEDRSGENQFRAVSGEAIIKQNGEVIQDSCFVVRGSQTANPLLNTATWQEYRSGISTAGFGAIMSLPQEFDVDTQGDITTLAYENSQITIEFLNQSSSLEEVSNMADSEVDQITIDGYLGFTYGNSDSREIVTIVNLGEASSVRIAYVVPTDADSLNEVIARILQGLSFYQVETSEDPVVVSSVKIALLEAASANAERGCDNVVLVDRSIVPTTSPLNAAINQLFSIQSTEFEGYNHFIPKTSDTLAFDRAVIVDGQARIYLTGALSGLAGVCDNPRAQIQLEETALQFETVDSVQLYLNGQPIETLSETQGLRG